MAQNLNISVSRLYSVLYPLANCNLHPSPSPTTLKSALTPSPFLTSQPPTPPLLRSKVPPNFPAPIPFSCLPPALGYHPA